MLRLACVSFLLLAPALGCSDDAPGGTVELTGGYEDWDYDQSFMGVHNATVEVVGDADASTTTEPNGRSTLQVPAGRESQVTFTHPDYLTARYTVEPSAVLGPYELRGVTPARIAALHDDELGGLTWDDAATLILIEVRAFPSRDPIDGVSVTIDGAPGFHDTGDAEARWAAGASTAGGAYLLFPNVDPDDGTIELAVDAGGATCHAPARLHVAAGELAATTIACED